MANAKGMIAAVFMPIVIGVIGLSTLMSRPRFTAFHAVDVLQLIASGMCFGVALASLVAALRSRRAQ